MKVDYFEEEDIAIMNVSCGAIHTLFVSDIGKVYSCGSNQHHSLGYSS